MKCCISCFNDSQIQAIVVSNSDELDGTCSFCGSVLAVLSPAKEVGKYIELILEIYVESDAPEALFIWECLQLDWHIFSDKVRNPQDLVDNLFLGSTSINYSSYRTKKYKPHRIEVQKVSGIYSEFWDEFSKEIKFKNRFFFNSDILNLSQLQKLMGYSSLKQPTGREFFRARRISNGEVASIATMGAPPPDKTKNGRANPVGIPYLYLSSDEKTAISETRPIIGESVSVGKFNLKKEIVLVNLQNISVFNFIGSDGFSEAIKYVDFLNGLAKKLSEPIRRDSEDIEYLPTQYLSEFVKKCGWDGFMFQSSQSEGVNVTLFDPSVSECVSINEFKVTKVAYEIKQDPPK